MGTTGEQLLFLSTSRIGQSVPFTSMRPLRIVGTLIGFCFLICWTALPLSADEPLRILPLGDSITRGTYFARYETGPRQGQAMGLPNPQGGGWRKWLQDQLRTHRVDYDFVGELNYHAYGREGRVDPTFDPDHHGLAGFSNRKLIAGGEVPTLRDVLEEREMAKVVVPDLVTVLRRHHPHVILLLSGANGFDAPARDELIRLIGRHSKAHLFVATLLPQRPPRAGWENVDAYNVSLPATVSAQVAAGHRITLVDLHATIGPEHLQPDGVHPNQEGSNRIAEGWFKALQGEGYVSKASLNVRNVSNSTSIP
jgi:lysophospholipase L1-like esterase